MSSTDAVVPAAESRSLLPAIGVAIPIVVFGIPGLSIMFAMAEVFGLSTRQTSTLIVTGFGISGVLSLALSTFYRQPLFLIWSSTSVVFMASLANSYTYAEMLGATFAAGVIVLLLGLAGLSSWLARMIPAPIVLGLLAGLVMPFVVRTFSEMQAAPFVIGMTVATFLLARILLSPRIPPILPALAIGLAAAAVAGDLHSMTTDWTLPMIGLMRPTFSWQAILTVTPVLVVLMSPLANLAAVVVLRSFQFKPPVRVIDITSGACTMLSAFLAPVPVVMGSFVTALTAGPEAGSHQRRYWSVLVASGTCVLMTVTASVIVDIPAAVPIGLLFGVAGLMLFSVLSHALTEVTKGPLRLGPLFAFVVASSSLSLGGFGPAFWALLIGMTVSLLLEQSELRSLRADA
jgi:benzoate membrane transport protein